MNRCSDVQYEARFPILSEQAAARVAELFRALGDARRVRILAALKDRELSVGALAARIGSTESAVSHQLRGLRQMRLVSSRRAGQKVHYRLEDLHVVALLRQGIRHGARAGGPFARARRETRKPIAEVVERCGRS